MRWLIGIGAGVIAALMVLMLIETIGDLLYPLPEPQGAVDPREQAQLIPDQPIPAKLIILLAWFGGTLVGAGLAIRLAGRRIVGLAIGPAIVLRNLFAMSAIAYPGWMWIAGVLLPLLSAWAAWRYMPLRPAIPNAYAVQPPMGPGPTWR